MCTPVYDMGVVISRYISPYSVNIPVSGGCGELERGSTLLSYLPPVPPKGTGFHRYVFSLYTHATPLTNNHAPFPGDHTPMGAASVGWLHQRRFSSAEFLHAHEESGLKPWSFAFFQAQWDKSVSHTYQHTLSESALDALTVQSTLHCRIRRQCLLT